MPPRRSRHLSPYKEVGHRFLPDLSALLGSPVKQALHTFKESGRVVDFIYEENASDGNTLVVSFPAAMTIRHRTFPYFNGRRAAKSAGLPILAFSDPAFAISTEILTGWSLGDSTYLLHRDIPAIIDKFRQGRRLLFIGVSAGGFPALHFSSMYQDSLCFAMNPRTALLTPPTHLHFSAGALFPGASVAEIASLIPTKAPRPNNHVLYAQNLSDDRYFASQMLPYVLENGSSEQVHTILGDWGYGHVPMSPEQYAQSLAALTRAASWSAGIDYLGGGLCTSADDLAVTHATQTIASRSTHSTI